MAPLLDTNHELNWHANMVDAIEQKAANQRAEGQSTPSIPATHVSIAAVEGYCVTSVSMSTVLKAA